MRVLNNGLLFLGSRYSNEPKTSFLRSFIDAIEPYKQILYAISLYIPTLIFSSEIYYLFLPFLIIVFEFPTLKKQSFDFVKSPFRKNFIYIVWLPFLYVVLSSINKYINGNEILCTKDYYASFYLLPLLILAASFTAKIKFYKALTVIICIESLVCLGEYFFNVRSFFIEKTNDNIILSKELLYYSHVFGLSANSSIIAMKLLGGFLLIELAMFKSFFRWCLRIILMVGLIITFNRAVLIAVFVFWILYGIYFTIINRKKIGLVVVRIFSPFLYFFLVFLFFSSHSFFFQFSRGELVNETLKYEYASKDIFLIKDIEQNPSGTEEIETTKGKNGHVHTSKKQDNIVLDTIGENVNGTIKVIRLEQDCATQHAIEMKEGENLKTTGLISKILINSISGINTSGRSVIWLNYFCFIDQHLLFGNGSDKLMLKTVNQDEKKIDLIHAHNSFIELFATNGLLLSIYFLAMLSFLWKKHNFILLVTILLYSFFQYGIFWGFSFLDVIFMGFLMSNRNLFLNEDK
ncbi:MAG: hypothetical protein RI883_1047 [Bacteroidota bacterium]|jgi:hypothetical protein